MENTLSLHCPCCGETVELQIDTGGGSHQACVEDCPVCCRPCWQVDAFSEGDGSWSATLRTADE